jgi:hypothetical protein
MILDGQKSQNQPEKTQGSENNNDDPYNPDKT